MRTVSGSLDCTVTARRCLGGSRDEADEFEIEAARPEECDRIEHQAMRWSLSRVGKATAMRRDTVRKRQFVQGGSTAVAFQLRRCDWTGRVNRQARSEEGGGRREEGGVQCEGRPVTSGCSALVRERQLWSKGSTKVFTYQIHKGRAQCR